MKDSWFWRVLGVAAIAGLLWIGYGLGKNGSLSSPSLTSAAYADDAPPAKEAAGKPVLIFREFSVASAYCHELRFERAKIDKGWMLMVSRRAQGENRVEGFAFYPDAKHEWAGDKPSKAGADELREEAEMKSPPRIASPAFDPSVNSAKAMELYDTDKDGKISGEELDNAPGLKAALKVMKTDKEKGITKEQIADRLKKWLDSRIGRTSLSCIVQHNGKPLEGAKVKFIPEKFLKDALPETGEGVTNQNGMAMISVPTQPGPDSLPPGIPPGMYRVEITKDGEAIPAKYNTETTLGQEVSLDNIDLQMGIKFNLKY